MPGMVILLLVIDLAIGVVAGRALMRGLQTGRVRARYTLIVYTGYLSGDRHETPRTYWLLMATYGLGVVTAIFWFIGLLVINWPR